MRNPKRIHRIMTKLEQLWNLYPDQRLGQLIENYVILPGAMRGPSTTWIFYAEDELTVKNIDRAIRMAKKS